jgi:CBS domain-containing protein
MGENILDEWSLDPKIRNTFLMIYGTIIYLVAVFALLLILNAELSGTGKIIIINQSLKIDITTLFALSLLPLLAIYLMIWGYGLRLRMPGLELEYYPVEKVMKPPSIISEKLTGKEAEEKMEKEKTDFLNILDKDGLFRGILTRTDIHKARVKGKIRERVRNLMTSREKVIHALEREDLKSIMGKIGQTKHSRLPVLDKNNRLIGIVDSVDINDLISKILK